MADSVGGAEASDVERDDDDAGAPSDDGSGGAEGSSAAVGSSAAAPSSIASRASNARRTRAAARTVLVSLRELGFFSRVPWVLSIGRDPPVPKPPRYLARSALVCVRAPRRRGPERKKTSPTPPGPLFTTPRRPPAGPKPNVN